MLVMYIPHQLPVAEAVVSVVNNSEKCLAKANMNIHIYFSKHARACLFYYKLIMSIKL